jgi:hypothetical protein
MNQKTLVTIAAATLGIISAVFWYIASTAEVPYDPNRPGDKSAVTFFNGDREWDVIRTAELQAKWNKRAAFSASIAASLQALALVIPGQ